MKKEEIEKRIEQINNAIFYIDMCDMWTTEDRENKRKLEREKEELTRQLEEK